MILLLKKSLARYSLYPERLNRVKSIGRVDFVVQINVAFTHSCHVVCKVVMHGISGAKMSRKRITLSPYGCASCVHALVGRCDLTGHKMRYAVNARHHCQDFKRNESRVGSNPDNLANHAIRPPYEPESTEMVRCTERPDNKVC
jgi:hypothetical protein